MFSTFVKYVVNSARSYADMQWPSGVTSGMRIDRYKLLETSPAQWKQK